MEYRSLTQLTKLLQRRAKVKVAVGISRELLRRYDPTFGHDNPGDKYYHVEKLNAHESDAKSKTYSYHVKWLGYRDEANLALPEPELSQAIVADYWEMTTDADNEGFDSDSDEESNFEVVIPGGAPEDD
ncbi:hypothetical protein HDU76_008809 [Blyttiomyces sp. JEL0837]|nr:hypothetical protein HDU76_008809 [Blyttiomyces sp. JEL0837]